MARLKESRWVYILLSIVLAIVFWVYVRASVDPNGVTSIHNVRVETTGTSVLASQGLIISDISPQMVELPVEGPTSARAELLRNRSGLQLLGGGEHPALPGGVARGHQLGRPDGQDLYPGGDGGEAVYEVL